MNNKNTFLSLGAVVLAAAIIAISMVLFSSSGLFDGSKENENKYTARFIAVCTDTTSDGWGEIKRGLLAEAESQYAAVEYIEEGFENSRAVASAIEAAVDARADGIVVYSDGSDIDAEIEYAKNMKVPIATIVNTYSGDEDLTEISVEAEQFALLMTEYIKEHYPSPVKIGIVSGGSTDNERLEFLSAMLSDAGMTFKTAVATGAYSFDAGETVKRLISNDPDISIICCTDANVTLGAAQSVVELNKVNSVKIMGSGRSEEIISFINKGVIVGTVAVDYESIGRRSINELVRQRNAFYSEVKNISADIFIIDSQNADAFTGPEEDDE